MALHGLYASLMDDTLTTGERLRALDVGGSDAIQAHWDVEHANFMFAGFREQARKAHQDKAHKAAVQLAQELDLPVPLTPAEQQARDQAALFADLRGEYRTLRRLRMCERKGISWADEVARTEKQQAKVAAEQLQREHELHELAEFAKKEVDVITEARAIVSGREVEDLRAELVKKEKIQRRRRIARSKARAAQNNQMMQRSRSADQAEELEDEDEAEAEAQEEPEEPERVIEDPLRGLERADPFTQYLKLAQAESAIAEYTTLRIRGMLLTLARRHKIILMRREDEEARAYDKEREIYDKYNELPSVGDDVYPQLNVDTSHWSPLLRPFVVVVQGQEFDLTFDNCAAVAGFVSVNTSFIRRCFAVLVSNRRKHTAIALQQLHRAAKDATQPTREAFKCIDGLTPLMDKMIRLLHDHDRLHKQLKYVRAILDIVHYLCVDDYDIQDQLISNSGLLYVVSLLNAPEVDITIKRKARKIIEIAPYNTKVVSALLQGASLPLIVNLTKRSEDADTLLVMLRVLCAVLYDGRGAAHAYKAKVMPVLLSSLTSPSLKVASYACLALTYILANNHAAQEELRQRGALMALVANMGSIDYGVRTFAAEAVAALCNNNSTNKQAVIQGAEGVFWTLDCLALEDDDALTEQLAYHCLAIIWTTSQRPALYKRNTEERKDALRKEWISRDMLYRVTHHFYSQNKLLSYSAHCILYEYSRDYKDEVLSARERYRRDHPGAPLDPPDLGPLEFLILPYRKLMGLLSPYLERFGPKREEDEDDLEAVRKRLDAHKLDSKLEANAEVDAFNLQTEKQQKILARRRLEEEAAEGIEMHFPVMSLQGAVQVDPGTIKKGRKIKKGKKGVAFASEPMPSAAASPVDEASDFDDAPRLPGRYADLGGAGIVTTYKHD